MHGSSDPRGNDLVINATSLGLVATDPLSFDATRLSPMQIVAEIIMDPIETPLLRAARARGCQLHFGAPMLAGQLELMVAFLLGEA